MSDARKQRETSFPNPGAASSRARSWMLPSIAVLPFDVAGDGIIDRYFADGVSTDIAGSLARVPELRVVGSTSPLPWRGPNIAPGAVAASIGARYILAGRISRSDQRLTFRQKLYDARSSDLVWTDEVEANIDHLFDVQHHIVGRVVNGIVPHIRRAEVEAAMLKMPESLTPYDLTLRALPGIRALRSQGFFAGQEVLRSAMAADPSYATPVAWLARSYSLLVGQGWAADRKQASEEGMRLARQAIDLDPTNSLALTMAGHLASFLERDYAMAERLFDRAIAACHNDPFAWALSGATQFYIGRPEEARLRAEHGLKLSPCDDCIHQLCFCLALACYGCEDYAAAVSWSRKALAENANYTTSHRVLAAALVGAGRVSEAREVVQDMLRLEPSFPQYGHRAPIADPHLRDLYFTHLRVAGALPPLQR